MKESIKKRWASMMGVFVAVFGSFAGLMYLSISTFSANQNQSRPSFFRFQQTSPALDVNRSPDNSSQAVETVPVPASWSNTILRLGDQQQVGHILVTYRGRPGRSIFRLDVTIPELDPQYTYLRHFKIENARKGFQVGAERFVLLSVGSSKIRLLHYNPAR